MSSPVLLRDDFYGHRIVLGKSNGDESSSVVTEEDEEALSFGDNSPEDVAEQENHLCFYFVKQLAYDDPEIKAKIEEANDEIYQCNVDRIRITNTLKSKMAEKLSLDASMEKLISSLDEYKSMNEVNKDQEEVTKEMYSLNEKLSELKVEIELLNAHLVFALNLRDEAFYRIQMLRLQRDKGNAAFFYNTGVMGKAFRLAASGNVKDLEEFSHSEVEKFMSRWNNDKAFREDYKKRVLPSFEDRKLRCDGRIKELEEDYKSFSSEEESDDATVYEKLGKDGEEINEETLKERKREEQLEKARLAMERKRKLHDKAAAKAAIRVKKDAEKKLKELEKRAKKKNKAAAFNSSSSDGDRTVTDASKPGKQKLLSERSVFINQSSFRYKHHGKGNEAVLKAIMKRKKAYTLWVWAGSLAALALSLALLVYFFYI